MTGKIPDQSRSAAGRRLSWEEIAASFRVISAHDILSMDDMRRHQDIKDTVQWLTVDERPLALLFISHRWETLTHPDPTGRHLRAVQDFVQRICSCITAMLVDRPERLQLVPSLKYEGTLQAAEVARRMFGFGPFSDTTAGIVGRDAGKIVGEKFKFHQNDRPAFQNWLLRNIGLWLDYICMPQKPLSQPEELEFKRSLGALDALVMSSTLVALRHSDDDYPVRGWCASEFFLASAHSFSRSLFIDTGRMEQAEEVLIADAPVQPGDGTPAAAKIMMESFEQDRSAFVAACERWSSFEGPLLQITPPDAWSEYRSLQGSSFFASEYDPNPMRRSLEAIRHLETALIQNWFMSDRPRIFDLGKEVGLFLQKHDLHCAIESDLVYLGFLSACHGWIDAFKPLLTGCLQRYLETAALRPAQIMQDPIPILLVKLNPLSETQRAVFLEVRPNSAPTWHSRLSTGPGADPQEKAAVKRLHEAFNRMPPGFRFISHRDFGRFQNTIETLY